MRRTVICFSVLLTFSFAWPAAAQTCTTTWTAGNGLWHDATKWSASQVPNNTDVACIDSDVIVGIYGFVCVGGDDEGDPCDPDLSGDCAGAGASCEEIYSPAKAKAIKITHAAADLIIVPYASLTLCDGASCADSRIDGLLTIHGGDGELIIANSLTIKGDGGVIDGFFAYGEQAAIKAKTGTTPVLTIAPVSGGNTDPADSLTITGEIDIHVEMVNNAHVIARESGSGTVRLATNSKSGSGYWVAQDTREIVVDVEVSGSGTWKVEDSTAKITINASSACLTGTVIMLAGTLDVNQDFITTGNITLVDASIEVASGKTARFGGAAGGGCSY